MDKGDEVDEAELLAQVAYGDRQAFHKFYVCYAPRVFRYALTLVRDRDLAEEVVQETMIAVWKGAKSFRGQSQVSTWVFGIACNQARQILRRMSPSQPEPEGEEGNAWEPKEPELPLDQAERVRWTLARLPQNEQEVVVLAFYQGFSYREIAQILGIPEGTVKSRMFQARRRLRALLVEGRSQAGHSRVPPGRAKERQIGCDSFPRSTWPESRVSEQPSSQVGEGQGEGECA